jgi:hypothetical protein
MSIGGDMSPRKRFAALWRRSPVWRFFAMTAPLLTLLFVLFPPSGPRATGSIAAPSADIVSYIPKSSGPAVAAGAPNRSTAAPPVAVVQQQPTAPRPSGGTAPRTATLTLATPGTKSADESGLDAALIGRQYRGSVTIDGFSVPLPPGDWANLANSTIKQGGGTGDAHFLGRIRQKRLVGAVRIFVARSTNTPGSDFPPEVKSCTEVNPGRTYVWIDDQMVPHGHQACWTIRNVFATPWSQWADRAVKISSLDRAAGGDMTAKGVTYPQDFIGVTFTRTEAWGLLEVMYLFNPDAEGLRSNPVLSVSESDWTPAHIERYPDKVAYIERLKRWGMDFWPKFKQAFAAAEDSAN